MRKRIKLGDAPINAMIELNDGKVVGVVNHVPEESATWVLDAMEAYGVYESDLEVVQIRAPLWDIHLIPAWIQLYAEGEIG